MNCELCDQIGGELLWQGHRCRVVLIDDPDYTGFCRVIWQNHVRDMTDLSSDDRIHFMSVVFDVEKSLREMLPPEKINLASLGNVTAHLHWHVVPRFVDDKHFPNPIWGAARRASAPRNADKHLADQLKSALLRNRE